MTVVGIDLGTTNTVVASVRQGKVHVLADEHGSRLLPSVVGFHPNGEVLVGAAAKARRVIDPKNTVYSHKRLIGRSWGSPEIVQAKQRFPFELREGPGQGPLVHARQQDYTLPEISAFVLKRARQIAETALGTPVERAVITVPAHFNELQRASTKVAGRVSGLEVLRILNEPTAAALAYGLGRTGNERVAVYDFGGGTFDCTLLDLNGNVFEVLATAGDSFLGGDDVDNMIAERMAENYLKAHRYDPRSDPQMFERLKTTAEEMKMQLSTAEQHTVVLKDFGFGNSGSSIHYTFTLTRRDLEAMITPLVDRSFKVTQDALSLARLTPTSFDKVILVGGSTRIPIVRKRVEAFFGAPPMDRVNPDEVVAIGAAIQAAALTEGTKRRSIPAPPPVMGQSPTTQRGLQNDLDATSTQAVDRSRLPMGGPTSGGPATRGGPPPTGATGARSPSQPDQSRGPRKITNPGVAPATQPLGARGAPAKPTDQDEDPSIASFPDLQVPTPFEWFPSSGQPGSGPGAKGKDAVSERSFGGNTITKTGQNDPNTMTAATAPTPAAGGGPGFGAIDEPPSMYSTPSASLPSFPSMTGGMPSPIGEPEPFGSGTDPGIETSPGVSTDPGVPGGKFGTVRDLSLISSSGVETNPGVSSANKGFGHVSDLSLISTGTESSTNEALLEARNRALETFDDQNPTEALKREPDGSVKGKMPPPSSDDHPDLPAVVEKADLPAISRGKGAAKKPETRKQGQVGALPSGSSAMIGKPPAPIAPQPFGPMEKVDEPVAPGPMSRTAAMQGRPPPAPAASKPAPKPVVPTQQSRQQPPPAQQAQVRPPALPNLTSPMPARPAPPVAKPLDTTASLDPHVSPVAPTQMSPFGSAPPPPQNQFPSGFPRGAPQVQGFSNAPPAAPPYQSAPPPMPPPQTQAGPYGGPPQQHAYPSAPPGGAFGSQPPGGSPYGQPTGGSQPPIFGSFSSAPPEADPYQNVGGSGGYEQVNPGAPLAPQNLGYAAPVLVDVTPRALVVETAGGYTDTIIPRNSKIPCERTRRFATGRDMQTTVRVRVAQGEHAFFPQNTYLGEVELAGLRPAPRGEVVVAVTFEVDADGTMRVRARDVQTGQEARATLQLVGVADESSVVMMINRFAQQPVGGGGPPGGAPPPGYPI